MLAYITSAAPNEMTVQTLLMCATGYVGIAAATVLLVKAIPNKLMLLGLLTIAGAVAFGTVAPNILKIAVIMAVSGGICLMTGVVAAIIVWAMQIIERSGLNSRA